MHLTKLVAIIITAVYWSTPAIANDRDALDWFYKRFTGMEVDIQKGVLPLPTDKFDPVNPSNLVTGNQVNLDKYFEHRLNYSAIALKDGKLVYKRFNKDLGARDEFFVPGLSMTKTAVGLVVGHVMCNGGIRSLDDTVGTYSKTLRGTVYENVKIRNLLRMASGVNGNRVNERAFNHLVQNRSKNGRNDLYLIFKELKEVERPQGEISNYHMLDVNAASVMISDITGENVATIFHRDILSTMQNSGTMFWWKEKNNITIAQGGLSLTTNDWSLVGQFINKNMSENSCIGNFLKDGIKNRIKSSMRTNMDYGYFFWVVKSGWNDFVILLTGNHGQAMAVNTKRNAVVMVSSIWDTYDKKRAYDLAIDASKLL